MSGLAALTANYTDSEDEDQNIQEPEESKSSKNTPLSQTSAKSTPTKQKINLVSYGDIPDENDDKDAEPVPMELESDEEKPELNRSMSSVVEVDAWNEGGKLPPEPEGTARKNNFRHFDILVHWLKNEKPDF